MDHEVEMKAGINAMLSHYRGSIARFDLPETDKQIIEQMLIGAYLRGSLDSIGRANARLRAERIKQYVDKG